MWESILTFLAEPLLKYLATAIGALITGYVAMVLAKWRKEAQLKRNASRDQALDRQEAATTEDEFAKAQKDIVNNKPR